VLLPVVAVTVPTCIVVGQKPTHRARKREPQMRTCTERRMIKNSFQWIDPSHEDEHQKIINLLSYLHSIV